MERFTTRKDGAVLVGPEDMEAALARLAVFEDMAENLDREQEEIARKLEDLRGRGKEKTVQFRELLAQKLVNNNMKFLLERYGLK